MSAPPEKRRKESMTISMVIEQWGRTQTEQYSAVHRINGYPWRLRLYNTGPFRKVVLLCDKSKETELWTCTAKIKPRFMRNAETHSFNSWDKSTHVARIPVLGRIRRDFLDTILFDSGALDKIRTVGELLEVEVELDNDGEKWNHPTLDPLEPLDGTLVIGNKKINVNKASLASQSSFFDRLFFGDFREKNMDEITIEDVEYEEFDTLIKIIYRLDGVSLTDENVYKVLQLADRFNLKIVENVCVNHLLSSSSTLSIHEKLQISEEKNLPLLKDRIISRYTKRHLRVLVDSPEWEVLSKETTKALMKKSLEADKKLMGTGSDSD